MGFWNSLFGGAQPTAEDEKQQADERQFNLMKYDGIRALQIGQTEYAVKCLREALKVRNDDIETHHYLQTALTRMGLLKEALAELQAMSDLQPRNVSILLNMAHLAYMEEDYGQMTAFCQKAEELEPDNSRVHSLFAQALLGQGDLVGGIARLTKSICLSGDDEADARLLRGQTLLNMGDVNGAQDDADWLSEHIQDHEDVLLLQARILAAKGQAADAIEAYGKVIDANPFHVDAYRERGRLRYDQGDRKGAEDDMQKLLELNPNETNTVSGDYEANGVEQKTRQAYSNMNPFGL
ncbi:MAG: tetratricopeptide repeat protein [Prevotella sp.]|nr:tetratricopeptide repeat protein [Prevotella sp.]